MAIAKARSKRRQKEIDAEIRSNLFGEITKFETFLVTYWKWLVVAGVVIVLGAGIWFGAARYMKRSARQAESALAAASTEEQLAEALQKYGTHAVANYARMRYARMLVAAGKLEQAEKEFLKVMQSGLEPSRYGRHLIDCCYMLEERNKGKDAADKLAEFGANAAAGLALRAEALCSAGRLYLQLGVKDKAKVALDACCALRTQGSDQATFGQAGTEWIGMAEFLRNTHLK